MSPREFSPKLRSSRLLLGLKQNGTLGTLVAAILLSTVLANSQDERPLPGFINVVNLISLQSPTYFSLDSFQLNEGTPAIPGSESGFISIKPGQYTFTARNEAAAPNDESVSVDIESEKNVILICFEESATRDDGSVRSKLRINMLVEALDDDLPRLSVVSLLDSQEVAGRIGKKQVNFSQRRALRHHVELDELVPISVGQEEVEEVDIAKEAHYMVFLFHDPETSEISTSVVVNREFEFQTPEEEKTKEN